MKNEQFKHLFQFGYKTFNSLNFYICQSKWLLNPALLHQKKKMIIRKIK